MSRHFEIYVFAALLGGCAGDGCLEPIPNGFPSDLRVSKSVQLRVSDSGLRALEENAAGVVDELVPGGLQFDVPPSCSGNPEICCGYPVGTCGVAIDLSEHPGDSPRLQISPGANSGDPVGVTLRARVRTSPGPLKIHYEVAFIGANCDVHLNTESSGDPSVTVQTQLLFSQDPAVGTTRVAFGSMSVGGLDTGDIDIDGNLICDLADLFKSFFVDTVRDQLEEQAAGAIGDLLCKPCTDNEQCAPYGTCDGNTCQINDASGQRCMQELGVTGRFSAAGLLEGFPLDAAFDLYLVTGGFADGRNSGLSLGFVAGARAGNDGAPICGPPAAAPEPPAGGVPEMSVLDKNQLAEVGGEFDFGLGVHVSFLERVGWAVYQSGLLCLTIDSQMVDMLNTDTIALMMPSLVDLLHGPPRPMAITLRPQATPIVTLGGASAVELTLPNVKMDFSAMIDERFARLFTAQLDLTLPLDLEIDASGALVPVLGDVDDAFVGATIQSTGLLEESDAEIADKLGALGALAMPMLADAIGPIELPSIAGLTMRVPPGGILPIDDNQFLGIFGTLEHVPASMRAAAETEARIVAVHVPAAEAFSSPRLRRDERPVVELELGGKPPGSLTGDLEWQVRVDGGLWSHFTREPKLAISRPELWLAGHHRIEVRARMLGMPETTDLTPAELSATIDPAAPRVELRRDGSAVVVEAYDGVTASSNLVAEYRLGGKDGKWKRLAALPARIDEVYDPSSLEVRVTDESGNTASASGEGLSRAVASRSGGGCAVSGSGAGAWWLALPLMVLALRGKRRWYALLLAALAAGAMGCTGNLVGGDDDDTPPQDTQKIVYGRWSDVAVAEGGQRTMFSAYEQILGDLVVGEVSAGGEVTLKAVDGVPDAPADNAPGTEHRGGVSQEGPDVGAWTSIAFAGTEARVAYQDREAKSLKFAVEGDEGWQVHEVDATPDAEVGLYASLAISPGGLPGIAYLAHGVSDGADGLVAELRWAQASVAAPASAADWTVEVIATAPAPETESAVADLPNGTGLFASAGFLPDGRAVVAFYDHDQGDLRLATRESSGWQIADLDADPATDTGRFASLAVGSDATVHVAYQDYGAGALRYVTWSNGTVGATEVVDTGARDDAAHSVGSSAALFLDAQGIPTVVYQDAFDVDVLYATRQSDGTWTRSDLLTGSIGHGFFISAAQQGGSVWVTSHSYDRAKWPPGTLVVKQLP